MKRLLSLLLTAAMVVSMIPSNGLLEVYAAENKINDTVTWAYNQNTKLLTLSGTGTVTKNDTNSTFYNADYHNALASAEAISISSGITGIGPYALSEAVNTAGLTLPDGLTSLSDNALNNVGHNLQSGSYLNVNIPLSVTSIGDFAFKDSAINNFKLLNSVTYGEKLFSNSRLTKIVLAADYGEEKCLNIANTLGKVSGLTDVTLEEGNTHLYVNDGLVLSANKTKLLYVLASKNNSAITLPDETTEICDGSLVNIAKISDLRAKSLINGTSSDTTVTNLVIGSYKELANLYTLANATNVFDNVKDVNAIDFTTHHWANPVVVTEPTLENEGKEVYTCSDEGCNETLEVTLNKWTVDWGTPTVNTTSDCKTFGNVTYTYLTSSRTETTAKLSHTYGSWLSDDSQHWKACTVCTAETTKENHTLVNSICTVCGYVHTHSWNEGIINENSTCAKKGSKTVTCTSCGEQKVVEIEMLDHTVVIDIAVEPTCTEVGKTAGAHCSECNKVLLAQTDIPALGHDFGTNYSSDETGHWIKCSRCDARSSEGNHSYNTNKCTEEATCTVCGYKRAAGQHSYVLNEETPADCTTPGNKKYICSSCQDEKNEPIAAPGHSFGNWENFSDTQHKRVCSANNEHFEVANHNWDNGVDTIPATCKAKGVKTYTCTDCGATRTAEIEKLEHAFPEKGTSIDSDTHKIVCPDCQEEVTEAHTFNNMEWTVDPNDSTKEYIVCDKCNYRKTRENKSITPDNHTVSLSQNTYIINTPESKNSGNTSVRLLTSTIKDAKNDSAANEVRIPINSNNRITYSKTAIESMYQQLSDLGAAETTFKLSVLTSGNLPRSYDNGADGGATSQQISTIQSDNGRFTEVKIINIGIEALKGSTKTQITSFNGGKANVQVYIGSYRNHNMKLYRVNKDGSKSEIPFNYNYSTGLIDFDTDSHSFYELTIQSNQTNNNIINNNNNRTYYEIYTHSSSHGSFSTSRSRAESGTKITIDIRPDSGYEVDEVRVTADYDGRISVREQSSNEYTFTMPSDDVEVRVTFKESSFKVDVETIYNGTASVDKTRAASGERVLIRLSPNSGYELNRIEVKEKSSNSRNVSNRTISTQKVSDTSYQFVMPSSDVIVDVLYKQSTGTEKTIIVNSVLNGSISVNKSKAKAKDSVTITVNPDKDYQLDNISVIKTSDNNSVEVVKSSETQYTFIMPDSDVKVSATFKNINSTEVTNEEGQNNVYYYQPSVWALKNGIVNNTEDKKLHPNQVLTRAEVIDLLWKASGKPEPSITEVGFKDVNKDNPYYTAILWAYEKKIARGTSSEEFGVNDFIDRGQIITMLYRLKGNNKYIKDSRLYSFDDVDRNDYFYDATIWAAGEGVSNGTGDNKFSPEMFGNTAQVITFIYRAFKEPAEAKVNLGVQSELNS